MSGKNLLWLSLYTELYRQQFYSGHNQQ